MNLRLPSALAAAATAVLAPASTQAQGLVAPTLTRVENSYDTGSTIAWFGYTSLESGTVEIPFGISNFISPSPPFRGQPFTFLPGTHTNVFSVTFSSSSSVEWTLGNWKQRAAVDSSPGGAETLNTFSGSGTITHTASRVVGTTRFVISGGGTLVVDQDAFSAPIFENRNGTVRLVGSTLTAATRFENGGTLRFEGGAIDTPSLLNTGRLEFAAGDYTLPAFANRGQLVVSGGSVSSNSALALDAATTLRLTGGTFTVPALNNGGGYVDLEGGELILTGQDLNAESSGPLGADPVLGPRSRLELAAGRTTVAGARVLTIAAGATLVTQGGDNHGQTYVAGGALDSRTDLFTNHAGAVINASSATLTFTGDGVKNGTDGLQNLGALNLINTTVHGDVHSPAGSFINAGGGVTFTGLVSGAGNFTGGGTVTFAGGYSPGDSPAFVTHEGDLVLASTNTLTMEIAGLAAGTGHDVLDVAGELVFGGAFELVFLDGFSPVGGERFDLFDFTEASGSFASLVLATLVDGLAWDVSALYTSGEIAVVAVPEPSAGAALAGLAALGFGFARRRGRGSI